MSADLSLASVFRLQERSAAGFRALLDLPPTAEAWAIVCGAASAPDPLKARWFSGNRVGDLVGTASSNVYLISPGFRKALTDAGCTGWDVVDVELMARSGEEIPGYALLIISGRFGPVLRSPPLDTPVVGRLAWDGSDLFVGDGWRGICMSGRADALLGRQRLRNVLTEPFLGLEFE